MKNRIEAVLKQKQHLVDYMEIRYENISQFSLNFSDRNLTGLDRSDERGLSIRACHQGGWGFTSFNSSDRLESFASSAIDHARSVSKDKTYLAEISPVHDHVKLACIENPRDITDEQKIAYLRKLVERCLSFHPSIANVKAHYFEIFRTIDYMNTDGTDITQEKLDLGIDLTVYAKRNGILQFHSLQTGSSNSFHPIRELEKQIDDLCNTTLEMLSADPVKAGTYPVILDPVLAGTFAHEAFGHMSEADEYMQNPQMRDIFTLNRQFGSEILSIYDSGLDEGTRGYIKYDDEGVPAEKTYLIKNGRLVGRLHSRESAARMGESPTGNARTIGYRYPPICRMRNTAIEGGTSSFDDLLQGIKLGVYAIGTHGGTGGEMFSFDAAYGRMIRNGKLAEFIRDVQISGNLFSTLKNIDGTGTDFHIADDSGGCGKGPQYPLETTCSAPHIRIRKATVGGQL